jgi:NAD(P)H-hydrate repair Nnr-like enzyme with NAD(P)H-hydrate epimerase domain
LDVAVGATTMTADPAVLTVLAVRSRQVPWGSLEGETTTIVAGTGDNSSDTGVAARGLNEIATC